jgi:HAMP domain-containing protein
MITSVHDPTNWSYALEGQGETVEAPRSPPVAEYTPTPPSPRITVFSNNHSLQTPDIRTQIAECRREIAELRQEVADLTLQMGVSDLTHATEVDCLYQEIAELRQEITVLRGSTQADDTPNT